MNAGHRRDRHEGAQFSDHWWCRWKFWRVQVGVDVMRHAGRLPDRWVFKTKFVYDRKDRDSA